MGLRQPVLYSCDVRLVEVPSSGEHQQRTAQDNAKLATRTKRGFIIEETLGLTVIIWQVGEGAEILKHKESLLKQKEERRLETFYTEIRC